MRKLIITAALASTVVFAVPASAQSQPYGYGNRDGGYDRNDAYRQDQQIQRRLARLRDRIDRLDQRGAVSQREAYRFGRELNLIERQYAQAARNGISERERYDLQRRIQVLQAQIRDDRETGRRYDDDGRYQNDGRYYDRRNDDRRERDDDD